MQPPRSFARHRVAAFLEKAGAASAAEIARALKTSPANIRHHLAVLQADGLVEFASSRRVEGRGRPAKLYSLSQTVLGNSLAPLASAVLGSWLSRVPREDRDSSLRAVAHEIAGEPVASGPLARRLAETVERLNVLHYHARWEAHASGPAIILGHCPFAAIIAQHPELCRMDSFILEEQLGAPMKQTAKLESGTQGLPFCRFVIP